MTQRDELDNKITVETLFDDSEIISLVKNKTEIISRNIIRLQDEGVKKALYELGYVRKSDIEICPECKGFGEVSQDTYTQSGQSKGIYVSIPCKNCGGEVKYKGKKGKGWIIKDKGER